MVDHSGMKLGKHAPRKDPRTLQMASYVNVRTLPPPPPHADWSQRVPQWPMMANDRIGDCTCAAAGHLIEEWTANASRERTIPDAAVIAAYSAISGYDPVTGNNDKGAAEVDVLNYWRKHGIGGHKIQAYVALAPNNHHHVRESVYLFGGCYIGLALPLAAQRQIVWSVPADGPTGQGAPGSWGGHAVPVVAYDERGLVCVTWGALKRLTWGFWATYCDEAYAPFSVDWKRLGEIAPNGIDWAALRRDLEDVTESSSILRAPAF
jgi:hypothetical protein